MIYDIRKDGQFQFSVEEIKADPVLKHISENISKDSGSLEVEADSAEEAFEIMFGIEYENMADLDESICPDFSKNRLSDSISGDDYEILSELDW